MASNQFSASHQERLRTILSEPVSLSTAHMLRGVVNDGNFSERSLMVRYSIARSLLKQHTSDQALLDMLLPPRDVSDRINRENQERRDRKKRVTVERSFIDRVLALKDSTNMYDLCMLLLLITGRRTIEILDADIYSTGSPELLHIDGVVKRSDEGNCVFPPLWSPSKTLKLLSRFRSMIDRSTFNRATFRRNLLARIRSKVDTQAHPHMFRGIYANYLFKFRNPHHKKINTFLMDVLCHETISTSLSYTGYDVMVDIDYIK